MRASDRSVPDAFSTIHDFDRYRRCYEVRCDICYAAATEPCRDGDVALPIGHVHYARAVRAGGGLLDKGSDRDRSMILRESMCCKRTGPSSWCLLAPNHPGRCA